MKNEDGLFEGEQFINQFILDEKNIRYSSVPYIYFGMIIGNPFNLMDYIREFTEYNIPAELGLYHLFYDDELVYVGKSVNIQNRLKRHLKDATKEFNNVLWFLASGLSDDRNNIEHISQWEKRLIQELNPPYNVVYNR